MPIAAHTSHFMAAKITAVTTSFVAVTGSFFAIEWSFDVLAFALAVIGLLAAVAWAWLIGRLDARYVKCENCTGSHAQSIKAVDEIKAMLKEKEIAAEDKFGDLHDRITGVHTQLTELRGEVHEALKRI